MSLNSAVIYALALVLLLFVVAAFAERRAGAMRARPRLRHGAYSLALGVYCSSWTFYGAVGSAVRDGWLYLPIYLAPILLLLAAPRFLARLAQAVAEEQATTVSDFIAARFGHDGHVARLVTVIALLGTVPYIALQFRSIGAALSMVSGSAVAVPAMIAAATLLALFAIQFGARRFELSGRNEGLLFAIGFESLFKLVALIAVCALAISLIRGAPGEDVSAGVRALAQQFEPSRLSVDFAVISLISMFAVIVLPRQFYMGLVQAQASSDLPRARLGFAAYLAVMALLALPIALAGAILLPRADSADLYLLELPAAAANQFLLLLALLGGISAAAAMVIVDATALATMVSNDLIFPAVLRRGSAEPEGGAAGAIGQRMLRVRAVSIVVIIALALAWALLLAPSNSLASIGLVAFAAMAQFTPHLILATLAGNRDPLAARVSLSVGLVLWLYTLGLPPILPAQWLDALHATVLDPLHLFGLGRASPLVHGVCWSLGANLLSYAGLAARNVPANPLPRLLRSGKQVSDLNDLLELTASFVGRERAEAEFPRAARGVPVDRDSASRARQLVAGVVGASSARTLVASALAGGQMSLGDVTRLLDQGGQSLRFSRALLAATFENIDAGISVIDAELNLVAWNSRYEELFAYPPGLVRVGVPVADLIAFNARDGDFGPGDVAYHVEKRLEHFRRRQPHSFERHRHDGRVIKTVGGPMPGGGYVMSFTDITGEARAREELRAALDELEQRVAARTLDLSEANRQLARAGADKTRFLAAASHDLLQPLHAARLFTAALERDVAGAALPLVHRVDNAIVAAEDLLRALLDISKLDAGGVTPSPEPLALAPFLRDLAESFRPMAEGKHLDLRIGALGGHVRTDPGLLRSVMQNFLANALRYTTRGGVLIGTRRRGDQVRIDVVDSGVGIEPDQIETVFGEFTRLGTVEVEGLGLGLALAERIVRLLGGSIEVRSVPGRGSRFSLLLPALADSGVAAVPGPVAAPTQTRALTIVVVDNDRRIVEASVALLSRLGHHPRGAADCAGALDLCDGADVLLADYQLDHGEDGLTLIAEVQRRHPRLPAALITAEATADIRARAAALGVEVFAKPLSPLVLEEFLARV